MKSQFTLIMLLLCGISPLLAQSDCSNAITVCGNTAYSGLTATGGGNEDELIPNAFGNGNNDCEGVETNSLWLRLPIETGGTLGFILTPSSPAIDIDFDFYIFGPNAVCGNLGHTVRCSTTNPEAAFAANNLTGMSELEADTFEGPGEFGSSFVEWMTVQAGEVYFLVIDRPIGNSDFDIEWTGTAKFYAAPEFSNPNATPLDILQCDDDAIDDKITEFDLTANRAMLLTGQPDVVLTYHTSINDAVTGEAPIANPEAFINTSNPQTIYMRMKRTTTECFETAEFQIEVTNPVVAGQPNDLEICDLKENGIQRFNLASNDALIRNGNTTAAVTYYTSKADAEQEINPLPAMYESGTKTIWARLENTQGCQGSDITSFTITVTPLPNIVYTFDVKDFTYNSNAITVVMPDAGDYEFSINNGSYSDNTTFSGLEPGQYTISIRAKSGCKSVSDKVVILNYPKFFTPNGDSRNDVWKIPFMNLEPEAVVTIYDRYGKVITGFKGSGSWDGTLNNTKLPATDYWFVLQLDKGREIKGHFSMIR